MSDDLKSCPFCGEHGYITVYKGSQTFAEKTIVEIGCHNCDYTICDHDTKEQSITAWNTRPQEDEKDKRIEELEDIIQELMPLDLVFGDSTKRLTPQARQMVNSTTTWLVSKEFKNQHTARVFLEKAKQALEGKE